MAEIPIAEGKNVTFKNVLSKSIEGIDEESIQESAKMFEAYVKKEGLQPYGPLILRETTSIDETSAAVKSEMLIQLREAPKEVSAPYEFSPQVRVEGCLMARFMGPVDKLVMAYSKMIVYAYERGMSLGSVGYTVIASQQDGEITADMFREIL